MKRILPAVAWLYCLSLTAQDFVQVSYGPSYKDQVYYRFADDATVTLDNNSWDIAFTTFGDNDAGIHLNESAVVFGAEAALYLAPTNNFDDPVNPDDLTERLYNDEKSWDYGAFNSTRNVNDPDDFGWGTLDSGTGKITGNTVFVLRFKNGTFKKMQIISLDQGIYTLKHADLDGNNETTLTVDKADFPDTDFAFLSFASGQTLPPMTLDWDLAFLRYAAPNDDGAGGIVQIMSSGVLSAPGAEVAQANQVIPDEVEFEDYEDSLSTEIDIIGSDWKFFNNVSWELANDLAYFIKTGNGAVWKIYFNDFGGSTTGNVVFTKELVLASGVGEESVFESAVVYPNPTARDATLLFTSKHAGTAQISLTNLYGQTVWSGKYTTRTGLNAAELPMVQMVTGPYQVTVKLGNDILTERMVKLQ